MAGGTVVVAEGDGRASSAVWQKEQKLATDNLGVSQDYLWNYVAHKLNSLAMLVKPDTAKASEEKLYPQRRRNRMRRICEDSSMAVEVAIKTLATLHGEHPVTEKEMRRAHHDIGRCLGQLSRPYRIAMTAVVTSEGLDLASLLSWRNRATYPDDVEANSYYAYERVDDFILTALSVTSVVISEFEFAASAGDVRVTGSRQRWRFSAKKYDTTEPRSGERRLIPLGIIDQLEDLRLGVIPGQRSLFNNPEF